MRQISSHRSRFNILLTIVALLLLTSLVTYGQSLGDVARENREKKANDAASAPPRVITNANLPKDPDESQGSDDEASAQAAPANAGGDASSKAAEKRAAQQRAAGQVAAARWKRAIVLQESTIASLRARVERLQASIHFVNPGVDYNAVAINGYEARQLERLRQLQQQLAQERKKLEDMQEAARHAGMHTATYDP